MKNYLPLVLASACVFAAGAEKTAQLSSVKSTDGMEETLFTYDSDYHLTKLCQAYASEPIYNSVRVFTYNDKGENITEQLYQDMNLTGSWDIADLHYNAIVEYSYNDARQLIERRNYNNWGQNDEPDFQLGGVITYEYNENGSLSKAYTYWDVEKTDLAQTVEYTYNADNQLEKMETYMTSWFSDEMELTGVIEYSYYDNGLRHTETIQYSDPWEGTMVTDAITEYTYDEAGNLLQRKSTSEAGTVRERLDFSFFSPESQPAPADEVAYPINLENSDTNFIYESFPTLVPSSHDAWVLSLDTVQLEYLATYEYSYEIGSVGVATTAFDKDLFGISSFSKESLRLNGVDNGRVSIYDMSGRVVISTNANHGTVDISALPAGTYCIFTIAGATKFVK